ncbi:hypothetical protein LZ30DRAFT_93591 [Colletotrichum cereale]|nr:hypothetical protein LZ30DRAFT_93591 [Colletotrichum cereale]
MQYLEVTQVRLRTWTNVMRFQVFLAPRVPALTFAGARPIRHFQGSLPVWQSVWCTKDSESERKGKGGNMTPPKGRIEEPRTSPHWKLQPRVWPPAQVLAAGAPRSRIIIIRTRSTQCRRLRMLRKSAYHSVRVEMRQGGNSNLIILRGSQSTFMPFVYQRNAHIL